MMDPLRAAPGFFLCWAIVLGCGSDGGSDEGAVRDAGAAYLEALADGDPEVCSFVSDNEAANAELRGSRVDGGDCESLAEAAGMPLAATDIERVAATAADADVVIQDDNAGLFFEATESQPILALYLVHDGEWLVDDVDFGM